MAIMLDERVRIKKTRKHIIWNYQGSPEIFEGIRFHWLTAGKLEKEAVAEIIMKSLSKNGIINSSLVRGRKVMWEKIGSKMFYTLTGYDTKRFLIDEPNLGRILGGLPYVSTQDESLLETLPDGRFIEDYVEQKYGLDPLTKVRIP